MSAVSLKIHIVKSNNVKTMQFPLSMLVYDVCRLIRERVPDAAQGQPTEYGLFKPDEDPTKGRWLEQGRTLEYYHLKNGDVLEYRKRQRVLRVRTLDGTIKTLLVDDSSTVAEITKAVCARIGLQNPEEFSFITEEETAEMTLKRAQAHARHQKEMDKLKKRHHTDDELNWLNPDKSLREQGVTSETQVLTLRKRLFFSDQNVDYNDPVQLNLLFVQSRDGIVNGTHPCTKDEAILFAAYQCQVQYGNHNDAKHKPGFLNLIEFLPREYVKIKGVEKAIYVEHRKLHNLSELHAKFRYIQLCRSLRTYGVTFFLVKEKMRGRNRLVPRLLGITRESVMRVDENTKEVLKTWPLTTVRRWAASPNSFTLDFGDYSEAFYSVQTTEGEKISQLIAAYIDIIMTKLKPFHTDVPEEEDEPVIVETENDPKKASMVTYHPSSLGHGAVDPMLQEGMLGQAVESGSGMEMGGASAQHGEMMGTGGLRHMPSQAAQNPQLLMAQQNVMDHITHGIQTVQAVTNDLQTAAEVPLIGSDSVSMKWKQTTLDVSRQNVNAAMAAMLASAAAVITNTGVEPEDINYTAVGSAVTTISTNLIEMAKAVRMLAALTPAEADKDNLLDAARCVATACAKLLEATEPNQLENRQVLLAAAGEMGTKGSTLLMLAGEAEVDLRTQEALVSMAKAVASATAALVTNARNVAAKCDDTALQNQVIVAAKQTALATQALIACTKVLAPCIDSPLCQEQLIEACKMVAAAVEKIVMAAQAACGDDDALRDLGAAATAVTEALNSLIQQIKVGVNMGSGSMYDEACEAILAATERLFNSMGNAQEMVKQAKILAEATSSLVNAIKLEAENETDPDARRRLLDAAKALADATSRMVEAAKMAAKNPQDEAAQEQLRLAAEHLRAVTNAAASAALKKKAIRKLEVAAKQAAAVSTQFIAAAQGAKVSNRNEASQLQLMNHCKAVAEHISSLVQAVRTSMSNQDSPSAQLGLINSSQAMIPPAGKMVAAAKAAVPTVGDQAAALQLGNFAKATAAALAELRAASGKAAEVCGSLEIDSAMDVIRGLARELAEARREAQQGHLLPLPNQTVESCSMELGATSKTVGSSMAQLLTAANQGNENYTGIAARDTANALRVLASAVRGVAAFTKNPQTQEYIIVTAQQVMDQSVALVSEAKQAVQDPNTPNKQLRLAHAAKAVSQALNQVVNCLPGLIEIDQAIKAIAQASLALQGGKLPHAAGQSYQTLQANLSAAASSLNMASSEVITSARGTPDQQAASAGNFSGQFEELLKAGMVLAGASKDRQSRDDMLGHMRNVSVASSKLLLATKALAVDPNAPNVQNQLASAARGVTDAINSLLNMCQSYGPGQRECDNALRNIEAAAPWLDNPNEPISELSYFDCVEAVTEKSMVLGESGAQITSTAKKGDFDQFGMAVDNTARAVCQLTEAAVQAAYLVGVADPSSEAAIPGLVDQAQFARAQQAITSACQSLLNPASSQEQILAAATVIAKHTSTLCNACKLASSKTSNPVAKKHFVQAAKDVASATANLVKNIKVLAADVNDQNREACASTTRPLVDAVDALVTFASSPQFASTPAKISAQARVAQEPILQSGRNVIKSSSSLLASAKNLAIDPNDVNMWQLLAQHTKAVSDSVKALLMSIRTKCPGQKECDQAIDTLNDTVNQLDQAILAAMSQSLQPNASSSLLGFQEQMLESVGEIRDNLQPLATAAKGEAEKLGHQVVAMANLFPALGGAAIGAASRTTSSQMQSNLLELSKTLAESGLQLMYAAKEAGGNPKRVESQAKVDEGVEMMKVAAEELTILLEKVGSEAGLITGMVEEVTKAQARINEMFEGNVEKSFADYQAETFMQCREMVKHVQEVVTVSKSAPNEIVASSREVTKAYCQLVEVTQGAIATIEMDEIAARLQQTMYGIGEATIQLIKDGADVQGSPDQQYLKRALADQARIVTEKVSHVVSAVQAGAIGTQACNEAVASIRGIIGDMETTAMFATAGALNPEGQQGSFASHRDQILETAKQLVEDTKSLVSSAAGTQEQLKVAAHQAVKNITAESEHVKLGAASLTSDDTEAQLLLLMAVKDVASSLSDLIDSTRVAAGKNVQDQSWDVLKSSAKGMVNQVSRLLKIVKNVEEEAGRGVRSLENTIDTIDAEIKAFDSAAPPKVEATVEDMVQATKDITLASSKTVAAGNSCKQIDISAAANLSRKAVQTLLHTCKGVAYRPEVGEEKRRVMRVGRDCAVAFKTLLELVHQIVLNPSQENKLKLPTFSKEVASTVAEIIAVAGVLKEGAGYFDPSDPRARAEQELLAAAAAIEAAAKKLADFERKPEHANFELPFEKQILEAAKNIANATQALVQSARAAQRELVASGKGVPVGKKQLAEDSQWSEGLVSAAKLVATATSNLCDAANQVVVGDADEDKLITAAKAVAAHTAQLLLACQVKADPRSESNRRLQLAGVAVKKATEELVRAAENSMITVQDQPFGTDVSVPTRARDRFKQQLEKQEEIARKRRELESLEAQLSRIRKEGRN